MVAVEPGMASSPTISAPLLPVQGGFPALFLTHPLVSSSESQSSSSIVPHCESQTSGPSILSSWSKGWLSTYVSLHGFLCVVCMGIVCTFTCVWAYRCVHMCACACEGLRLTWRLLFRCSPHVCWCSLSVKHRGWQDGSFRYPACSGRLCQPSIPVDPGDLKSSSSVWIVSPLTSEPSLQPSFYFYTEKAEVGNVWLKHPTVVER